MKVKYNVKFILLWLFHNIMVCNICVSRSLSQLCIVMERTLQHGSLLYLIRMCRAWKCTTTTSVHECTFPPCRRLRCLRIVSLRCGCRATNDYFISVNCDHKQARVRDGHSPCGASPNARRYLDDTEWRVSGSSLRYQRRQRRRRLRWGHTHTLRHTYSDCILFYGV